MRSRFHWRVWSGSSDEYPRGPPAGAPGLDLSASRPSLTVSLRWGESDPDLAPILEGTERAPTPEDAFELEHIEFVRHHPAFPDALDRLREDLRLGANVEWSRDLIRAAIADPDSMDYPARRFAQEWGLTVAAVYYLALNQRASVETEWLATRATPLEYVIRVPRPLTPARRQALIDWAKSEKEPGTAEQVWSKAGKRRWDESPRTVAAIPWFERWNAGEAPAVIFREVNAKEGIDFETFHSALVSVWKRMRAISADGVREERPSKAPA